MRIMCHDVRTAVSRQLMNIKKQQGVKILALLVIMAIGLLSLSQLVGILSEHSNKQRDVKPSSVVISHCDLTASCQARTPEGVVDLTINPASLPVLQPLALAVTLTGIEAQQVTLEFVGRDMPMGLEPIILQRSGSKAGSERYIGTGGISFCTVDKEMVWLARIHITTKEEVKAVIFELEASRT